MDSYHKISDDIGKMQYLKQLVLSLPKTDLTPEKLTFISKGIGKLFQLDKLDLIIGFEDELMQFEEWDLINLGEMNNLRKLSFQLYQFRFSQKSLENLGNCIA